MSRLVWPACGLVLNALLGVSAAGQIGPATDFEWAVERGGRWAFASNWNPQGVPGVNSPLDTVRLGGNSHYTVTTDGLSTQVAAVWLDNPNAVLEVQSLSSITVDGVIAGPGVVRIGQGLAEFVDLHLGPNGVLETELTLDGPISDFTVLSGAASKTSVARLAPTSVVRGNGRFGGRLLFEGAVRALPERVIRFALDDHTVTGGGTFVGEGGEFDWNGHTLTNVTLTGDVVFTGDATIGTQVEAESITVRGSSNLSFATDVIAQPSIRLEGGTVAGPTEPGSTVSLPPGGEITGDGAVTGNVVFGGVVRPGADGEIDLPAVVSGGGVIDLTSGSIRTRQPTMFRDITMLGDYRARSSIVTLGEGVAVTGDLVVETLVVFESEVGIAGDLVLRATLRAEGVSLTNNILLDNAPSCNSQDCSPRAKLSGAIIREDVLVTGSGTLSNVGLDGTVIVGPDDLVLFEGPGVINGPGMIIGEGGDVRFENAVLSGLTLVGDFRVFGGNQVQLVGCGLIDGSFDLIGATSFRAPSVSLADGTLVDGEVWFASNGLRPRITGSRVEGLAPSGFGPNAVVRGTGSLANTRIEGLVHVQDQESIVLQGLIDGGGTIQVDEGGRLFSFDATLQDINIRGPVFVGRDWSIEIGQGVLFEGATIELGERAFTAGGLGVFEPGAEINGELLLQSPSGSAVRVLLPSALEDAVPVTSTGSITGQGRVQGRLGEIDGLLAPFDDEGAATLDIDRSRSSFGPTAEIRVRVAADPSEPSDLLLGTSVLTLGGTLTVDTFGELPPLYTPTEVIRSGFIQGEFDRVRSARELPPNREWRAQSDSFSINVFLACTPDIAIPIGELDIFDLIEFMLIWLEGEDGADLTGEGLIDIFDVIAYLESWNAGCGD